MTDRAVGEEAIGVSIDRVGGWGGGNVGGSVNVGTPSVRNYREGSLVIHAIDRERNAEVWQGRIAGRLTEGSLEPAAVQHAVSLAMKDFPIGPAPGNTARHVR